MYQRKLPLDLYVGGIPDHNGDYRSQVETLSD